MTKHTDNQNPLNTYKWQVLIVEIYHHALFVFLLYALYITLNIVGSKADVWI